MYAAAPSSLNQLYQNNFPPDSEALTASITTTILGHLISQHGGGLNYNVSGSFHLPEKVTQLH